MVLNSCLVQAGATTFYPLEFFYEHYRYFPFSKACTHMVIQTYMAILCLILAFYIVTSSLAQSTRSNMFALGSLSYFSIIYI